MRVCQRPRQRKVGTSTHMHTRVLTESAATHHMINELLTSTIPLHASIQLATTNQTLQLDVDTLVAALCAALDNARVPPMQSRHAPPQPSPKPGWCPSPLAMCAPTPYSHHRHSLFRPLVLACLLVCSRVIRANGPLGTIPPFL